MIQIQSNLKIIDNSGAKEVHCIKVLGGRKLGSIGNLIVVSLRSITRSHKNLAKKVTVGKVYRCLIIQTKKEKARYDGSFLKFAFNGGVLLNMQNQPIGTRIKGTVPIELRDMGLLKTVSLGSHLI